MLNKHPMSGEMDGPPIPELSTHMDLPNIELSQMVTLSTTESFPIPFSRPTPMPRLLEKLPLMLKRNPMSGEMDSLPTQDQFFPFNKNIPKTQLMPIPMPPPSTPLEIHSRRDKINTTPEFYGVTNPKSNPMPGELSHGLQPKRILD
jgi:hypothetical protein